MTTPSPRRLVRLLRGLGALIVLVAIVVGVPVLAVTLQRVSGLHVVPHRIPSLHEIGHGLTQRDNGQLVAVILVIGVWICWALFTLSLIPEIIAAARQHPVRRLPGLGLFQHPAGALVATITIAFTMAPLIAGVATAGRAAASPPPLPSIAPPAQSAPTVPGPAATQHTAAAASTTRVSGEQMTALPTYPVQRRDTLWKIAHDHLGDPLRYPEIVALNPTVIGPDNEITAGALLTMPADATGLTLTDTPVPLPAVEQVQVQPGDTLWAIERQVTGKGTNWTTGWVANKGRAEPDGQHFDDPGLIRPGWTLSIPTSPAATVTPPATVTPATTPPAISPLAPTTPRPPAPTASPHATPTSRAVSTPAPPISATPPPPPPAPEPATPSAAASSVQPARTPADAAAQPARSRSGTRYESVEVGGGLLAAVSVAALMAHRRRAFRHRRLGHVVASLPPQFAPLEQALFTTGRSALATMTFLDLALRNLTTLVVDEPGAGLPDIVGAAINNECLELYLAGDAGPPPEPWLATSPTRWTLNRAAGLDPAAARRFAPYPCLVSVGYTDDGTEYLLDLEHAGAVQLVGDQQRCLDLARYMVAELANNVWSDHLTVTVAGFARELIDANPTRIAYTDDAAQAARALSRVARDNRDVASDTAVTVLQGRLRGTAGDVWMPHVLLAAPGQLHPDAPETEDLVKASTDGGRAAVAVVLTGHDTTATGIRLTVTDHGTLITDLLPVTDIVAFALPVQDAADLAQVIALDRDGTLDELTPASTGDRPWDRFTDTAGALLPAYTRPRAPAGPTAIELGFADTSSLLPAADEVYLAAAATTSEDLAVLAPAVSTDTRAAVEHAIGTELDERVAAYLDPGSGIAKLDVLGPVKVTAYGRPLAKQEAFCTEIVCYLWQHPNGVSTAQFANDLWPDHHYVGTDSQPKDMASTVRSWLGVDPRTGTEYFPRATRGGGVYRIDGLLVSWDLFRQLRVRGEARGIAGRADLITALRLVTGPPMTQLRDFGYRWMAPGDDLLYTGAILEVAHAVATWSLEAGDHTAAIHACEVALQIDPEDDRALLCIAKAHEKAGRQDERDATILRLTMLPDPPERTLEIMRRNGWLSRGA